LDGGPWKAQAGLNPRPQWVQSNGLNNREGQEFIKYNKGTQTYGILLEGRELYRALVELYIPPGIMLGV
jgi:hypothetical protein